MSAVDVNQLLNQMKHVAALADRKPEVNPGNSQGLDFAEVLRGSVEAVNDLQNHASDMSQKFELGDPSVNLTEVMVELQKANVSFEAMKQVRNKLLTAYKDVMSMQV
ncbi:flagellar hook-basal body complex protein FliE [Thiolapillus brandeum]|nr:flagellar hook-basal body complex protein FliE [Thiolapillus brandeum]